MKKPEIICDTQYCPPEPVPMTMNGITFYLTDAWALLYRMVKYVDMQEDFMEILKTCYRNLDTYKDAERLMLIDAERKRAINAQAEEQKRLKDKEKARQRRIKNKNGVITPENAVPSL